MINRLSMHIMSRLTTMATCLLISVSFLIGCAVPSASNMVPIITSSEPKLSDKTLRVASVTGGGGVTDPGKGGTQADKIGDNEFKKALVDTFSMSSLFSSVVAEKASDYELHAKIIDQDMSAEGVSVSASLFVDYRLIDTSTKKEVWEETILSKSKFMTIDDAFAGVTRCNMAFEAAGKHNIEQLLTKLSEFLLTMN